MAGLPCHEVLPTLTYIRAVNSPEKNNWYENWFDSHWYHLLYKHRDAEEAEKFIGELCRTIQPAPHAKILDLACGKGRHASVLNRLGYDVTGVDLSGENISEAKKLENKELHFFKHDMRETFRKDYFNCVMNLFTSFGYFENDNDNRRVVDAVYRSLAAEGIFVLDFFNALKVKAELKQNCSGVLTENDAHITWKKKIEGNRVVKEIVISEHGKVHYFHEMVKLFSLNDLRKMMEPRFSIDRLFGNYTLGPFDEVSSDRLIIVAVKK
ncbi:MAG: class I SAM-dependent methyltransferase [Bacteroidetes bacterium]|nr:class I SAM-dependent methyltransferase [Bacteroidota bacterium]